VGVADPARDDLVMLSAVCADPLAAAWSRHPRREHRARGRGILTAARPA